MRHKSGAEHCASIPAASLVLMDMNIYLVEDITSGWRRRRPVACRDVI